MKMKIEDIIIVILAIISIAVVLWHFLGSSPTLLESLIILILIIMFISNIQVIKNSVKLNLLEKGFDKLDYNIKDSFDKIKEDMNLIKKKLKI